MARRQVGVAIRPTFTYTYLLYMAADSGLYLVCDNGGTGSHVLLTEQRNNISPCR